MWPVFQKEVRENALYLLGAFGVVLLIVDLSASDVGWSLIGFWASFEGRHRLTAIAARYANNTTLPLISAPVLEGTWGFLCFLLSVATALCQVYREQVHRTWPLLAHLPLSRTRMIFAKALAGLFMYALVLVPVALLEIVALARGSLAWPGPLRAYMFFPVLDCIFAGAVLYLAVFLCALRPARWYATKWVLLIAAIVPWTIVSLQKRLSVFPSGYAHIAAESSMLFAVFFALAGLGLIVWAIREQARTREY
jgi:ABC-type transport system involved in multi-copper enzyme maturation permease subunit